MEVFNGQINDTLKKYISEINSNPEYARIRDLYRFNFDKIENYINMFAATPAIGYISKLDNNLTQQVIESKLLLKEINGVILNRQLTLNDMK